VKPRPSSRSRALGWRPPNQLALGGEIPDGSFAEIMRSGNPELAADYARWRETGEMPDDGRPKLPSSPQAEGHRAGCTCEECWRAMRRAGAIA
jgi:hypothetical protein